MRFFCSSPFSVPRRGFEWDGPASKGPYDCCEHGLYRIFTFRKRIGGSLVFVAERSYGTRSAALRGVGHVVAPACRAAIFVIQRVLDCRDGLDRNPQDEVSTHALSLDLATGRCRN